MRSTAADHMKWASSAPTKAQKEALKQLIKDALKDTKKHEVALPCGSVIGARQDTEYDFVKGEMVPNGVVSWIITDGTSGAIKTGAQRA